MPQGRGAEGANPDHLGTKLSGKRTVIYPNPGKIPVHDWDTEGDKSQSFKNALHFLLPLGRAVLLYSNPQAPLPLNCGPLSYNPGP